MERMKRAVSLLLCFVMVFGLLPMSTFAAETEWVPYEGANYYEKVTSMQSNTAYVITRNRSTYYALTRNSSGVTRTSVAISQNSDGTYNIADVSDSMTWYIDASGHIYCTVNGRNYYLNASTSSVSISTTASTVWSVNASRNDVTISTSIRSGGRNNTYYLRYYSSSFSVSTSNNTLSLYAKRAQEGGQARLNGELVQTISVGDGTTLDQILSKVTVEWDSDRDGVADRPISWSDCDVTSSYDNGTAGEYVLTVSYNDEELGTVTVHVQDKAIIDYSLNGSPVTVAAGAEPDYSGVTLTVTYEGGTTKDLPSGVLTFGDVDTSMPGVKTVDVSYGSWTGTLTVNVVISYDGLDHADMSQAPEYPANGAVRIDKTADSKVFEDTGVVEVELDVAGISVKSAVDVILVTDLSNSMARPVTDRNNDGVINDNDCPSDFTLTKVYDLAQSVSSFADIFLANNEVSANTVSLVTFGGFDAQYTDEGYTGDFADVTQTLLLASNSVEEVKTTIGNIRLLKDSSYSGGFKLSFDGGANYSGNYGNTNYDYAFMETLAAINALKTKYAEEKGTSYDESGRQIYVVFMTDGAPSNYNGVYYNYKNKDTEATRPDVQARWINQKGERAAYQMGNNGAAYNNAGWYKYIAGSAYDADNDSVTGNPLYWADQVYNTTSVANIYNIGFDIDHGGFSSMQFTQESGYPLTKVLEKLVTGKTLETHSADDKVALDKIYSNLATKIRYAGTSAQVTDVVDSDFTLQMSNISGSVVTDENGVATGVTANLDEYGIDRTINVKLYDLWTKAETTETDKIGTRKKDADGNEIATVVETVSFNDDGTEAYSTVNGVTSGNIMSIGSDGSVIISARYFTYTKTADGVETFKWIIGNITDKEIALSFFAYLKNSLEGHAPKGTYYTNEEAKLEYIDIHGDYAVKIFPVPTAVWGGASTTYEFYLVNENGDPVNRNGDVIPFPNRIIITGPYTEELYLNQGNGYYSREIVAAKVLPAGYTLYDETASYVVNTTSGHHEAGLDISDPADGKKQTTILVSADYDNYTQSRVAFGVYYNHIPNNTTVELNPDSVVIDYGKAILVDITNGQATVSTEDGGTTYDVNLVGFARYYADVDVTQSFTNISYLAEYDATYGTFTIEDAANCVVRYSPHALARGVEDIFCVVELVNTRNDEDSFYMVEQLTVIPATIVYYETNFADGVFTYDNDSAWNIDEDEIGSSASIDSSAPTDQVQSTVQIGTDLYGYDASYNDDGMFSDGESFKALGRGYDNNKKPLTYTLFTFRGTGFDLISRTGAAQGLIKVEVFSDAAMTKVVKTVSVLNKSESDLELYQIPVVSINDLAYNTYYVRIAVDAGYENKTGIPALNALNRGNEFYFDAIRIYDPVMNVEVANQAYIADGEANNDIYELRSLLLGTGDVPEGWLEPTVGEDEDGNDVELPGVVFVDRDLDSVALANYETIGPNNEVYLTTDQAIGFTLDLSEGFPASIDLGLKSANGTNATVFVEVFARNEAYTVGAEYDEFAWYPFGEDEGLSISSCTVQFYDLISGAPEEIYDYKYIDVIITNYDEDSVLSVTDLKLGWGNRPATVSVVSTYNTLLNSVQVLTKDEEDVEVPEVNYDVVSASFTTTSVKKNKNATLTIVTSDDVESIEVRNSAGKKEKVTVKSVVEADGQKTWTVTFKINTTGNKTFTITGFGEDGTSGASATACIKVNR